MHWLDNEVFNTERITKSESSRGQMLQKTGSVQNVMGLIKVFFKASLFLGYSRV